MPKALTITPSIRAAIVKSTGDAEFDTSKVSVFETIALNTLPINKRGLFNGATTTEATLQEMADFVHGGGFVPLHTLHEQGYELPVGRVFDGEKITNEQGLPELRAQFFIDNTQAPLVSGVDTGSIEEVSVGLTTQHLNCSVCGFDYLGAEATSDNIYGLVCNEGHEIGKDGTHVILSGMARWLETSLVSLGAAKNAKILSRTKSLMGNEAYEKLAATGVSPEATVLFAQSPLTQPTKPEQKMEIKELVTLNANLTADKAVALHQVTTLTAANAELTTAKAALQTQVNDLTAKLAAVPADATKAVTDLAAATDAMKTQLAYVRKEADRLSVAAGVAVLPETATFAELTASIDVNRDKLSAAFGGGKAQGTDAGTGDDKTATVHKASAYKMA
jgi:FtsZ-binding cell division protein ZapB